jgi:hypothetical protein
MADMTGRADPLDDLAQFKPAPTAPRDPIKRTWCRRFE